ncbi:hypothetical protein [Methylobacterium sp. Leaf123]|uniref:DUF6894 family protein n=1 Tax=Methylobacterium sp. Leaf123 TaxID=1736264 RepID=UPI0012E74D50|nr:hypothetical protein [Methylobacterium sp. Leaf123]
MPRYYFLVNDGKGFDDDEGMELENFAAAMREAVHYAGCLLKETKLEIRPDKAWSLSVCDISGHVLFQLDLKIRANAHFATEEPDLVGAREPAGPKLVVVAQTIKRQLPK